MTKVFCRPILSIWMSFCTHCTHSFKKWPARSCYDKIWIFSPSFAPFLTEKLLLWPKTRHSKANTALICLIEHKQEVLSESPVEFSGQKLVNIALLYQDYFKMSACLRTHEKNFLERLFSFSQWRKYIYKPELRRPISPNFRIFSLSSKKPNCYM